MRGDFPFPLKHKLRASHKRNMICEAKGEIKLNNNIGKRALDYEVVGEFDNNKAYQVEKKGEHTADITIRCRRCNQFLLGYDLTHDDNKRILEQITLPPCRCKRVLRLMKYTEGILRMQAENNVVRL